MNIRELERTVKQFGGVFGLCVWDYGMRRYPVLRNATTRAVLWECPADHSHIDYCHEQIKYFKENHDFTAHLLTEDRIYPRPPEQIENRPFY